MHGLNGKNNSIPIGMVFRKYYCHCCGTRLEKERTHRVVSKDDKDYYVYHEAGNYPRRDHDVYDHRFVCPQCRIRMSYRKQCIIERIQKKLKRTIISDEEIKENFDEAKEKVIRRERMTRFSVPTVFLAIFFTGWFLLKDDITSGDFLFFLLATLIFAIGAVIDEVRNRTGKSVLRRKERYSDEEKQMLEDMHNYSANNKDLILKSTICYCFHCKRQVTPSEIVRYLEIENTAICPYCGVDSIIPDSTEHELTSDTVDKMNKYWF